MQPISLCQALFLMLGNASNLAQGSHSQVHTTVPTPSSLPSNSGHVFKIWFAVTMLSFQHSWHFFFFFLCMFQRCLLLFKTTPFLKASFHSLYSLIEDTRQDFLSPCSIGSAHTNDRRLSALFCSPCLSVSATRQWATWEQGFDSDHRPLPQTCLWVWQNTYWKKGKKWREMKSNDTK